jgi:hypothetical protein
LDNTKIFTRRKMKEYRDIAWMGWLLLRTASSSNRDMYFVLTREILDCYPLPRGLSRDSVTIRPEHALVDLDTYGFVKIRTMHLRDILFMKLRRVTLFLATTSGGLYLSDYDGQNARLRELCDGLFARNVGRMVVGAGIVYNATVSLTLFSELYYPSNVMLLFCSVLSMSASLIRAKLKQANHLPKHPTLH